VPDAVTCPRCKSTVPWTEQDWDALLNCCRGCSTQAFGAPPTAARASTGISPESPAGQTLQASNDTSGQAIFLTFLGLACIAVGLYYLVLHPSNPDEYGSDSGTITLHRLVLGQTATIAGVIFCAAAWRPR